MHWNWMCYRYKMWIGKKAHGYTVKTYKAGPIRVVNGIYGWLSIKDCIDWNRSIQTHLKTISNHNSLQSSTRFNLKTGLWKQRKSLRQFDEINSKNRQKLSPFSGLMWSICTIHQQYCRKCRRPGWCFSSIPQPDLQNSTNSTITLNSTDFAHLQT